MFTERFPRLIRLLFIIVAVNAGLFFLFRMAFWAYFNNPDDPLPTATFVQALYLGLKYDLRLAIFIVLPISLLAWIKPFSLFRSPIARRVWIGYLAVAMLTAQSFYILNFGHFAYLHSPLDATALRFLENPSTSLLMVWQSYPVIWVVLGWLTATVAYAVGIYYLIRYFSKTCVHPLGKRHRALVVVFTGLLMLFGMYGKLSWYPLRWSDAFATTHAFASAVTINPILYSLTTLKNKQIDFDITEVKKYYPAMVDYLGVDNPDIDGFDFTRRRGANKLSVDKPNIVVVILESFASYKTGLSGNPLDPTPHFDALAQQGIYFKNFFTPTTGTARSVFTAMTGMPDVESVSTSTRNPLVVDQSLIINAFTDYEKLYFIGGSASWGNIRGLLLNNIPKLKLYEEGSYESPRADVWGISDLHLFEEANKVLRQTNTPFISVIQTSGNHRPYTILDDTHDFQLDTRNDDAVKNHGFASAGEFNSFRFMDYSVGLFMQAARKAPYFDNTIFVFFGDHGIDAPAGRHTPKSEEQLKIQSRRVPLVIYAPRLLPTAKVFSTVASEVDVFPTLAGLAGVTYVNTTIGRDLFDARHDHARYAFLLSHGRDMSIGVIDRRFYFRVNSDGLNPMLFQLDSDRPRNNVMSGHPDKAREMQRIVRGIFETTRYMRYHNSPASVGKRKFTELSVNAALR